MFIPFIFLILVEGVRRDTPCITDLNKLGFELTTSPVYPHYKPAKIASEELVAQIIKLGTNDLPVFKQGINEGVTDWVDLSK